LFSLAQIMLVSIGYPKIPYQASTEPREITVNGKTRLFVIGILIALLPSCGGGSAIDVAGRFWDAVNDGDLEKAREYCTEETAASLTMNDDGGNADVNVEFGETTVEDGRTIIETRMVARMGDVNQNVGAWAPR
jgi:hypothetical protein